MNIIVDSSYGPKLTPSRLTIVSWIITQRKTTILCLSSAIGVITILPNDYSLPTFCHWSDYNTSPISSATDCMKEAMLTDANVSMVTEVAQRPSMG